nr:Calcium-transporting ATPase 1 family protein [Ipomoea batatas]
MEKLVAQMDSKIASWKDDIVETIRLNRPPPPILETAPGGSSVNGGGQVPHSRSRLNPNPTRRTNEILEALGLDSPAPPLMNSVQRSSTVQVPSMASQQDQFSPPMVQLEVSRDKPTPLVLAEEIGNPIGDSELLATNREVKVCEGVDPCLVDNGMIKEEIDVEVIDKNEQLLAPVNWVGIDDENDRDNEDGFNNSVEQMEKSVVVEGELMKNSHTPKMPYELLVKQAELIAIIESPSLGLGALNPIGDNGEFKGMNMMVIFYPGGIKPEFSLSARNNSTEQCVFEYGFLESRWLKPEGCLLIANEGLLIFRLLLDQFMDTLVEILLVVVVKLLMLGWYNKEEGKIPKNEVCCITIGGSAMRMVGYALQEWKILKEDKKGVLMRLLILQLKFTPQYGRIHKAQTEMELTSSPRQLLLEL